MLAMAQTCAVLGLEGHIVQVEVDISPGLPAFNVVGLADTAVQESRERVRAALRNSGCEFPMRRITVNLAPADLKKAGPSHCRGHLVQFGAGGASAGIHRISGRVVSGWESAAYQWHLAHGLSGQGPGI